MGKYDPLGEYLRAQAESEMTLSFREIERIIGAALPASAMSARWWANDGGSRTAHAQKMAWTRAKYRATLHAGRKVRFRKVT